MTDVELKEAAVRGLQDPPDPTHCCRSCNWFCGWEEGTYGMSSDGQMLGGPDDPRGGQCRQSAPLWPVVAETDWCGDWEPR